jgi:hypothetical protein
MEKLAKDHKVTPSYFARVVRLACLAPDIVETTLGGKRPAGLPLRGWLETKICPQNGPPSVAASASRPPDYEQSSDLMAVQGVMDEPVSTWELDCFA